MQTFDCQNLAATVASGAEIINLLTFPSCVYVHGEMGAGKTTLCQSIIKAAGYSGTVTSPTYNLIHEYKVDAGVIYHMDLYRLNDPSELEFLALGDLWNENSLFLIEWPSQGDGYLRKADVDLTIECEDDSNQGSRKISISCIN